MHYHFLLCGKDASVAQQKVFELMQQHAKVIQVFFYADAVWQTQNAACMSAWQSLVPEAGVLKVCASYLEKYHLSLESKNLDWAGLVDFFAIHWQDHGVLLQF